MGDVVGGKRGPPSVRDGPGDGAAPPPQRQKTSGTSYNPEAHNIFYEPAKSAGEGSKYRVRQCIICKEAEAEDPWVKLYASSNLGTNKLWDHLEKQHGLPRAAGIAIATRTPSPGTPRITDMLNQAAMQTLVRQVNTGRVSHHPGEALESHSKLLH